MGIVGNRVASFRKYGVGGGQRTISDGRVSKKASVVRRENSPRVGERKYRTIVPSSSLCPRASTFH